MNHIKTTSNAIINKRQSYSVLTITTLAYIMCYIVWMMLAVVGIPIRNKLHLNDAEFGVLVSTVLFTGSVARVPIGLLADRFGGRIVMLCLLLTCTIPVWMMSYANAYWEFLVIGLFVGLSGGSFSVGMSYVAQWFPQHQRGFALGVYGSGGAGGGLGELIASFIVVAYGWTMVPKVYAVMLLAMAALFWFFSYPDRHDHLTQQATLKQQLSALKDMRVLRYCQYYATMFGAFVTLSLLLVRYYVDEFGLDIRLAATLAACYTMPGTIFRAPGGWLADKYGGHKITFWVLWIAIVCCCILSIPHMDLIVHGKWGPQIVNIGLSPYFFATVMLILSIAFAVGKASVFKYVAVDYSHHMGVVSGIVGLAGGVAGSVLSIWAGVLSDYTGIRASAFWLTGSVVLVSLLWLYWSEVRSVKKS